MGSNTWGTAPSQRVMRFYTSTMDLGLAACTQAAYIFKYGPQAPRDSHKRCGVVWQYFPGHEAHSTSSLEFAHKRSDAKVGRAGGAQCS